MELSRSWTEQAENWIAWARADGHDSYWRFHRRVLFGLLPAPGRLTLDVGCGEGRVTRDLAVAGHRAVGFDLSVPMARAAGDHPDATATVVADAARLPVPDGMADLVLAFMSVQDMDQPEAAVREVWRVLEIGGRLHLVIVHPINSAGAFLPGEDEANRPFVIEGAYLGRHYNRDEIERDGYRMRFDSEHRSMEQYSRWLEDAGFVIETVREVGEPEPSSKWFRIPLFLHVTARKLDRPARDRRLFHITSALDADRLEAEGRLAPPSLAEEGFVHLSRADQVVASSARHFPADAELVLVEIDPERLVDDLRWPEVYPGQRFPHLHGPLLSDAVVAVHPWGPSDRAAWRP